MLWLEMIKYLLVLFILHYYANEHFWSLLLYSLSSYF